MTIRPRGVFSPWGIVPQGNQSPGPRGIIPQGNDSPGGRFPRGNDPLGPNGQGRGSRILAVVGSTSPPQGSNPTEGAKNVAKQILAAESRFWGIRWGDWHGFSRSICSDLSQGPRIGGRGKYFREVEWVRRRDKYFAGGHGGEVQEGPAPPETRPTGCCGVA